MFFEKFTDIFVWVLAVIAVIVCIPLAIVLMPLILIAVFILSCFDEFDEYSRYLEKQKQEEDKTTYDILYCENFCAPHTFEGVYDNEHDAIERAKELRQELGDSWQKDSLLIVIRATELFRIDGYAPTEKRTNK